MILIIGEAVLGKKDLFWFNFWKLHFIIYNRKLLVAIFAKKIIKKQLSLASDKNVCACIMADSRGGIRGGWRGGGVQSNPPFCSKFHFHGKISDIVVIFNIHISYALSYTSLQQVIFLLLMNVFKFAVWVANSEDPDQTPRSAASDLGLHCLLRPVFPST